MKKLSLPIFIFFIFCKITLAQSSLPECKGNDVTNPIKKFIKSKKWNSCHGSMLTLKGNPAYIGEFNKGQPHGFGTFMYAGRKYVGEWKNGKQHGEGTYMYVNGDRYVGEWKKGLRHGSGTFTYSSGKFEKGIWKKDKLVKSKQ